MMTRQSNMVNILQIATAFMRLGCILLSNFCIIMFWLITFIFIFSTYYTQTRTYKMSCTKELHYIYGDWCKVSMSSLLYTNSVHLEPSYLLLTLTIAAWWPRRSTCQTDYLWQTLFCVCCSNNLEHASSLTKGHWTFTGIV